MIAKDVFSRSLLLLPLLLLASSIGITAQAHPQVTLVVGWPTSPPPPGADPIIDPLDILTYSAVSTAAIATCDFDHNGDGIIDDTAVPPDDPIAPFSCTSTSPAGAYGAYIATVSVTHVAVAPDVATRMVVVGTPAFSIQPVAGGWELKMILIETLGSPCSALGMIECLLTLYADTFAGTPPVLQARVIIGACDSSVGGSCIVIGIAPRRSTHLTVCANFLPVALPACLTVPK